MHTLARAYLASGQYQRASHVLKTSALTQKSLRCRHLAAECHLHCKEWEQVLMIVGREPDAIESEGDGALASSIALSRGVAFESLGNVQHAQQNYSLALRRNVYCYEALEKLTAHHIMPPAERTGSCKCAPPTANPMHQQNIGCSRRCRLNRSVARMAAWSVLSTRAS